EEYWPVRRSVCERLRCVVEEGYMRGGVSAVVLVSAILHTLLIIFIIRHYHPITAADKAPTMLHYVELIRQTPQFTEAPGAKTKTAPLNAPFSDANRHASMPKPTGDQPTLRPGEGG